ncbi:MAG: winged helix-turn-helix domain-containing protein [Promethearchaeota archaeon]
MAYQDVITFTPERIKIVYDKKINEILLDPNHAPIIRALRKGPMTVRELEEAYAGAADKNPELEAKSDKTIYRYLKVLENAELVVPAGQRVVIGKTATETLFSRTADVFITGQSEQEYWSCETGKELCDNMAYILSKILGNKKADKSCIVKFMNEFDALANKYIVSLVEAADDETVDLITGIDWAYKDKILSYVSIFAIALKNPELFEKLRACFK